MSVSAALKARVRRPSYLKKIAKAEDLIHHFPNDAYIVCATFKLEPYFQSLIS